MRQARRALLHPSRHGGLTTHPGNPSGRGTPQRPGAGQWQIQIERDIMQCDDRRFKAMVRGDQAALKMALADSLTYTHSSCVHDTKAQFLASLTMGHLSYKSIIPEARSVRVYGVAGIVTGTARMEITARAVAGRPAPRCAPPKSGTSARDQQPRLAGRGVSPR